MSEDELDVVDIRSEADHAFPATTVSSCTTCPIRNIIVSVRRDFPIRNSEKFGAWRWTDLGGTRGQHPIIWSLPYGPHPEGDSDLEPSRDDPIRGWSLGRPSLGRPGGNGGTHTTDRGPVIAAEVKLKF